MNDEYSDRDSRNPSSHNGHIRNTIYGSWNGSGFENVLKGCTHPETALFTKEGTKGNKKGNKED